MNRLYREELMTQITTYTSTEEVAAIYAHAGYQNEDGTVNFDAIAQDILDGEFPVPFTREDLLSAYVSGTGDLPSFMTMALESSIPDPDADAVESLWDEPVTSSLMQLGDTMVNSEAYDTAVETFLRHGGISPELAEAQVLESELMGLASESGVPITEETAEGIYDLFKAEDLTDMLHLFMQMGNPGMALLLWTAYALAPAMQELQEECLVVLEELNAQQGDLMGQVQGIADNISPDDLGAQYEAQVINQQLDVIKTVIQSMMQFMTTAQDTIKIGSEAAAQYTSNVAQNLESILRAT
ncbi:MAG: hypothetical protein Q7T11_01830 [Deltaproteobacteria bacterium]|nr:hypothetical protein [Deltaproteobacteria bacterium]